MPEEKQVEIRGTEEYPCLSRIQRILRSYSRHTKTDNEPKLTKAKVHKSYISWETQYIISSLKFPLTTHHAGEKDE